LVAGVVVTPKPKNFSDAVGRLAECYANLAREEALMIGLFGRVGSGVLLFVVAYLALLPYGTATAGLALFVALLLNFIGYRFARLLIALAEEEKNEKNEEQENEDD
jgi:hypothetical protein